MSRLIDISRFCQRITFVNAKNSTNDLGQSEQEFVDMKTVWADVRQEKGNEPSEVNKVVNKRNYKIYTRFYDFVNETSIIRYKGRILEIISIVNINEENRFYEIICSERIKSDGGI